MELRYWLMVAGLGIIWGTSFTLNEILLREIGPLSVSLGRVALGALFCWAFIVLSSRSISFPQGKTLRLVLLASTNFAIPLALFPIAQQHLASGIAGVINGLTPVAVVLISQFWPGGEKANLAKYLGVVFGFAGIYLLSVPSFQAGDSSELWALIIALAAPICYGISLNLMRGFDGFDTTLLVAYALAAATLIMLPTVLLIEGRPVITQTVTWLSLGWIGLIATGFAFIGLYWLVPRVGGANMSTATFIAPVAAISLGVMVLGEKLTIYHVLGMVAILGGMLAIDGRVLRYFKRPSV